MENLDKTESTIIKNIKKIIGILKNKKIEDS